MAKDPNLYKYFFGKLCKKNVSVLITLLFNGIQQLIIPNYCAI